MAADSVLELAQVSKSFGSLKVADSISFVQEQHEALGIIGPNGAGKSTLFNLITGYLRLDSGTIFFEGKDVTLSSAMVRCKTGMGRSFQVPQPFAHLSVFENLLVAGTNGREVSEAEMASVAAEILERTSLIGKANVLAISLSLLERKRLELARALATGPKLLLLDEIAGGLTEAECGELVDTINAIRAEGVAIVWIEHVLHALASVVDRILVLNFGKVIALGKADEVMAMPEVREIYLGIEA